MEDFHGILGSLPEHLLIVKQDPLHSAIKEEDILYINDKMKEF